MRDQFVEADIAALAPFRQDRLGIEEDGRGLHAREGDALMGERHAVIEAGEMIGIADPEIGQHFGLGEGLHAGIHPAGRLAHLQRQGGEGGLRHRQHPFGIFGMARHGAYSSTTAVPQTATIIMEPFWPMT